MMRLAAVALFVLALVAVTLCVCLRKRGAQGVLSQLGKNVPADAFTRAEQALREMELAIPVQGHDSPRFEVGSAEGIAYLNEHGYAIFKGAASPEEVAEATDLFWEWAESLKGFGIRRGDPDTWNPWPGMTRVGIIPSHGIGQSAFLWYIRGLPKVKQVFEQLWNTSDLITSFDGCGVFRPWAFDESWRTKAGWWHVDQNIFSGKRGLQAVQGLVALTPATDETGGLVVVPRSHHAHEEVCKANASPRATSDFVTIDIDDPVLSGAKAIMLRAQPGDLILWDSRTVHCNTPALREPETDACEASDLIRLVAYVCMTPRSKASEDCLQRRRLAYERGVTSSHWPHELKENDDGTGLPPIPLTPEQRRLVGYDE